MTRHVPILCILMVIPSSACAGADATAGMKQDAIAAIDKRKPELIELSDKIWALAETALRETESARLLAGRAEREGFHVERGVAGLPTAFVASFGSGRPIVGILGEYDALPGLSQKALPRKQPRAEGAGGHGCGHNLFGTASLAAAEAVKEQIAAGRLQGTIRFYGCPAEETLVGKVYMARAGLFNDLDVCLAWHPGDKTASDTDGSRAMVDFLVDFHGRTAHASSNPWLGRSALDGLELFTHGLNMMREHVKPSVRMHYAITQGGIVPNIVPERAQLWCWVRDTERSGVESVLARLKKVADGAGLMAEVESKLTVQSGVYEMLVNQAGAKLVYTNLAAMGPIAYTEEEQEFARSIQREAGVEPKGLDGSVRPLSPQPTDPPGGSTDVADVSWIAPMLNLRVTSAPVGVPWHSWAVAACGGMSIGHKAMIRAADVLAITMVDLFSDPQAIPAIRAEFHEKTKGYSYKPMIPDGPPRLPGKP